MEILLLLALVIGAVMFGRLRSRVTRLEEQVAFLAQQLEAEATTARVLERVRSSRAQAQPTAGGDDSAHLQAVPVAMPQAPLATVGEASQTGQGPQVAAPLAPAAAAPQHASSIPTAPHDAMSPVAVSPAMHEAPEVRTPWPPAAQQVGIRDAGMNDPIKAQASEGTHAHAVDDFDWSAPDVADRPARTHWVDAVKGWFTTGNVPVKVGMLVLLAGLAALLRYASVQGWVSLPMWARLAGIGAVSMGALAFGWRQRTHKPAFAVAVQGGALGALLLTVFAAFKLYGLMGPMLAFVLSALLIAAVAAMATVQNALTLAVLSVLAGFLAPIWLSTGSGNHVALFSYYALLNVGILAMAWHRPWRLLNLLGFAFTWGIGVVWGVLDYSPAKFASTEPFLLLFFVFYLALPILHARKAPAREGDRIDGCLLFGTPLVAFSLQALLLEGARWPLAGCAVALALVYAVMAKALRGQARYAALARVHRVLAVGFATLAVPLAFSAKVTGAVFAVEGAALVWLGLRQQRMLPQWSGALLQGLAALAWMDNGLGNWVSGWLHAIGHSGVDAALSVGAATEPASLGMAVFNARFMAGVLLAASSFTTAWLYAKARRTDPAVAAYVWGMLLWLMVMGLEIDRHVASGFALLAWVGLAGVTGWLAAELPHRTQLPEAKAAAWTGFMAVLAGFALAGLQAFWRAPLAGWGALAWAVYAALLLRAMRLWLADQPAWAVRMHAGGLMLLPVVVVLSLVHWLPDFFRANGWQVVGFAVPWLGMWVWSMRHWSSLRWPLGDAANRNRSRAQVGWVVALGGWWGLALFHTGWAPPLPWLPLLNPLDAVQLACLALLAVWLGQGASDQQSHDPLGDRFDSDLLQVWRAKRGLVVTAGVLLLSTAATLRAVHHWLGLPWDASILQASATQTVLTVVWSVLGMACWVMGSRQGKRSLWLLGAALMGVVLVKLLLVDRQNLGDLLGIGAFMAYGLLCTLVGWLAPAPPKAVVAGEAPASASELGSAATHSQSHAPH